MHEVNSLCKVVEKDVEATHPTHTSNKNPENETSGREKQNGTTSEINPNQTQPVSPSEDNLEASEAARKSNGSPTELNPKLIDLATKVKDLNVRFATTCMHAKQHYASLSKVLASTIKRQSLLRSSIRSNQSQNGHYVRVTGITERTDAEKPHLSRLNSGCADVNSHQLSPCGEYIAENKPDIADGRSSGSPCSPEESKHSSTTSSHSTINTPVLPPAQAPSRKQGVAQTTKASVLATDSPNLGQLLGRSLSVSAADPELGSRVQAKYRVVLRSRSVDCENYTDNQPRSKLRPRSAVIIEPSANGDTVFLSELQLGAKQDRNGSRIRRRSMEINLSSLAKSGILSESNIQASSTNCSPSVPRTPAGQSPGRRKKFGSFSTLPSSHRSSVASVESLDPRTMISGHLQQNAHFNTSIGSDMTSSLTQMSGWSPERRVGHREMQKWSGRLLPVENGLQSSKRSASMDTINVNKKKG